MLNTINKVQFNKRYFVFFTLAVVCLFPVISSPIALVIGFTISTLGLVPEQIDTGKITKKLLAYSIVGLGFGINLPEAIAISSNNIGIIVCSIFTTLLLGIGLTKALKINLKMGHLIASGTAICGGSAIAAVAPAIDADATETSHALATVFILNSVALFVFPLVGHWLAMSQHDFGIWSAIAIHDTSSVVGAASVYGDEALQTATTLKLARALWIIPVAFISALIFKGDNKKIPIPLFILFYCVAIAVAYFLPQFDVFYQDIFAVSKRLLVLCLFLIGAGLTIHSIKSAGVRPLLLGVTLWVTISVASLCYIVFLM
ncbi:putative sulfate exporter family transporter [Psychromonas sp. MME2]|uniref:YeiH family protein n=1 Tax=unclassified Psychromonas TaxID=2614957 RepID=UPI00339CD10C